MVTFVTLFLGLVLSRHPVEVAVNGPVAAVELRLDGTKVGVARGEPWVVECDFGEELAPHELVAIALDADGGEIARARQWVNLPRSRAEASLSLSAEPGGRQVVQVGWRSMEGLSLRSVGVDLDGQPLPATGPDRFLLSAYDPNQVHLLTAEVELEGGLTAHSELVLGGRFGDRVAIEMTAVPLVRERPRKTPAPADLDGLLVAAGKPLPVAAVDAGGGEIVVVRAPDAVPALGALTLASDSRARGGTSLESDQRIRFLSTLPSRLADRELPFDLFPLSEPFAGAQIDHLLARVSFGAEHGTPRVSDAVAAAGVQAAAGNGPRLVLLVLGGSSQDASRFEPAQVRAYLERLRVPLVVWSTELLGAARISEDRTPMSTPTPWGTARVVSSDNRYLRAVADLRRALDSQLIAWVEGDHLPQSVDLAAGARGLGLAR